MHKLLYYCQGRHLAVTGEPLFTERAVDEEVDELPHPDSDALADWFKRVEPGPADDGPEDTVAALRARLAATCG